MTMEYTITRVDHDYPDSYGNSAVTWELVVKLGGGHTLHRLFQYESEARSYIENFAERRREEHYDEQSRYRGSKLFA